MLTFQSGLVSQTHSEGTNFHADKTSSSMRSRKGGMLHLHKHLPHLRSQEDYGEDKEQDDTCLPSASPNLSGRAVARQ